MAVRRITLILGFFGDEEGIEGSGWRRDLRNWMLNFEIGITEDMTSQ